jgi:O-antigen/teichoic acid export membrane protein
MKMSLMMWLESRIVFLVAGIFIGLIFSIASVREVANNDDRKVTYKVKKSIFLCLVAATMMTLLLIGFFDR